MFVGHFALGFAAKRVAPQVSLGTLFLAAQLADLVWPPLVLLGVETVAIEPNATAVTPLDFSHYPFSHSLAALIVWGALFALCHWTIRRAPLTAAITLALLVVSHWLLDFIAHRPDMPLTIGGSAKLGLGLWNSVPGTLAVEFLLLIAGVWLYTRTTMARDRIGAIAFWALVAFLALVELANLFGPPPPNVAAVAWSAQAMWLLVAWGYWVDRHRAVRIPAV